MCMAKELSEKIRALPLRERTLTAAGHRGGAGSSTLIAELASSFARLGLKVLVVDLTAGGGGATGMMGVNVGERPTLVESLAEMKPYTYDVPTWGPEVGASWISGGPLVPGGSVEILPANRRPGGGDAILMLSSDEYRLVELLEKIPPSGQPDLILIDPPGSFLNLDADPAIIAAGRYLMPIELGAATTLTAERTLSFVAEVIATHGLSAAFDGLVPMNYSQPIDRGFTGRMVREIRVWNFSHERPMRWLPGIYRRQAVGTDFLPLSAIGSTARGRRTVGDLPLRTQLIAVMVLQAWGMDMRQESDLLLAEAPEPWRPLVVEALFDGVDGNNHSAIRPAKRRSIVVKHSASRPMSLRLPLELEARMTDLITNLEQDFDFSLTYSAILLGSAENAVEQLEAVLKQGDLEGLKNGLHALGLEVEFEE